MERLKDVGLDDRNLANDAAITEAKEAGTDASLEPLEGTPTY